MMDSYRGNMRVRHPRLLLPALVRDATRKGSLRRRRSKCHQRRGAQEAPLPPLLDAKLQGRALVQAGDNKAVVVPREEQLLRECRLLLATHETRSKALHLCARLPPLRLVLRCPPLLWPSQVVVAAAAAAAARVAVAALLEPRLSHPHLRGLLFTRASWPNKLNCNSSRYG